MPQKIIGLIAAFVLAIIALLAPTSAQAATNWESVDVSSSPFIDTLADGTVVTVTFGTAGGYWASTHPPAFYKSDASGGIQTSYVKFSFSRPITNLKTYYAYLGVGDQSKFSTDQGDVNLAQNFPTGNLVSSVGNFLSAQPAGTYTSTGVISSLSGDRSATLELAFSSGISWLEFRGVPSGAGISGINLTGLELEMTSHSIQFDSNGGQGSMSSQIGYVAGPIDTNTFTKTGFTFSGWNTAANGSGTAYVAGANFLFTSDTTLYAQWTANSVSPTPANPVLAETGSHTGFLLPLGLSLMFLGFSSVILTRRARN